MMLRLLLIPTFLVMVLSISAQPQPDPCSSTENHQFDFWIGEWDVYAGDQLAGTNKIERILGDCVLKENWEGSLGSKGQSFNAFDSRTKKWYQTWVDSNGSVIHFSGHYEDDKMLYVADWLTQDGRKVYYKMTFFNNKDKGTVRQLWEQSLDKTEWVTIFDGIYVEKGTPLEEIK